MKMMTTAILGVVAAVAIAWGVMQSTPSSPPSAPVAAAAASTRSSLWQLAYVGLPGDRLLAAGLTSAQIVDAASRLRDAATQLDQLETLQNQLETAESQLASLRKSLTTSTDPTITTQIAAKEAEVASLRPQADSARTMLRNLVLLDASAEQKQLVERGVRGLRFALDAALALATDSVDDQRNLATLLKAEERALRLGEELDAEDAALLALARSNPVVTAASVRMTEHWAGLKQALSTTP